MENDCLLSSSAVLLFYLALARLWGSAGVTCRPSTLFRVPAGLRERAVPGGCWGTGGGPSIGCCSHSFGDQPCEYRGRWP